MPFKEVNIQEQIRIKELLDKGFEKALDNKDIIKAERELLADIKKKREDLGLTQSDLAMLVDCTQQEISRYENGGASPTLHSIERIIRALGYDIVLQKRD